MNIFREIEATILTKFEKEYCNDCTWRATNSCSHKCPILRKVLDGYIMRAPIDWDDYKETIKNEKHSAHLRKCLKERINLHRLGLSDNEIKIMTFKGYQKRNEK